MTASERIRRDYPVVGRKPVDKHERELQTEYEDALWELDAAGQRFSDATISLSVYQRKHPDPKETS